MTSTSIQSCVTRYENEDKKKNKCVTLSSPRLPTPLAKDLAAFFSGVHSLSGIDIFHVFICLVF